MKKALLFLFIFYFLFLIFFRSQFFTNRERINIVFQSDKPVVYSMDLEHGVNYFIPFYSDLKVTIPGGYGKYRLGALDKLASLDKSSDLYKRTYSILTSSFINYYFYQNDEFKKIKIYFGGEKKEFSLPGIADIFLANSNTNLIDKFYIFSIFFGKNKSQFKAIELLPLENDDGKLSFSTKKFFEKYQGYFYKSINRREDKSVQIIYARSYGTALSISNVLEGEGVRVSDLTVSEKTINKCEIIDNQMDFSDTAKIMADFFNCSIAFTKIDAYDIIFKLGNIEKDWEVK